jgi:hypothetical protein
VEAEHRLAADRSGLRYPSDLTDADRATANQERELREVAGRMACEIVKIFKDHGISGAKGREKP